MWQRAFQFEISGLVPEGPAVLAANHASVVDHFIVAAATDRFMANVTHKEAFDVPLLGAYLRRIGCIPIERSGGSLEGAMEVLARGDLVCMYPEGNWSEDGALHKFRTGAARLAQAAKVPLIPLAITGSYERRKGKMFRLGGPVKLEVLPPLDVVEESPREATEKLRVAIQQTTGLPYIDAYAEAA